VFDDELRRWAESIGETAAELVIDLFGPRRGSKSSDPAGGCL
jgi:hypothetical protein